MSLLPAAVLWDVDGTLADSEPVHARAFEHAARDLRVRLPADFHDRLLGRSEEASHAWLVAECGLSADFPTWQARRIAAYLAMIDQVRPHPAALALWQRLAQAGVPQAAVSNSDRMIVGANLARIGVMRPGLVSLARNDVRCGKPDPEPWLRASALLGVDPSEAVVVEDSTPGVESALAAGAVVHVMDHYTGPRDGVRPLADLTARLEG